MKRDYDLIVSLGGSCAVASQLKARGLRLVSGPFDWIFTKECASLTKLLACFQDDFKHWLLPENLVDIDLSERNATAAKYQYKDLFTGFRFIHDFVESKEVRLPSVREKYLRRINRLYDYLRKARRVALCFDADFPGSEEPMKALRELLLMKFGSDKTIDLYLVNFAAAHYGVNHDGPLAVYSFTHPKNDYIFKEKSFEFAFMDDFALSDMFKSEERGKGNRFYLARTPHGLKCILFKNRPRSFACTFSFGSRKYEFAIGGGVS